MTSEVAKRIRRAVENQLFPNGVYDTEENRRSREIWLRRTLAAIPPGARILDAGAGELKYRDLCAHLDYVSQDFAEYDGRGDSTGLQMGTWDQSRLDIVSDITDIPEPDGSFDAVMCIEVFEHLPDPALAIREFSRLLKPGGHLIVTAPFCSLTHFAPYHFSSGYNRYYYEHHLGGTGFEILELEANGSYFAYLAQELTRLPSTIRQYASPRSVGRIKEAMRRSAMRVILDWIAEAADDDGGSRELLCFGYHVLARKR